MVKMEKMVRIKNQFALLLLVLLSTIAQGQSSTILPFTSAVPQSVVYRPSLFSEHKRFFGIPFLSNTNIQWTNSALNYTGAHTLTDTGAYLDLNVLLRDIKPINTLAVESDIEFLSFGFGGTKDFFSFNMTHRSTTLFRFTDDFINLLYQGNGLYVGESVDLSKNSLQASHFMEIGFGYNRKFNEKWSAGIRVKRLLGIDNVSTDFSQLTATTAPDDYTLLLNSNAVVNTSSVWLNDNDNQPSGSFGSISRYLFSSGNGGWALNAGVSFVPSDRWTVTFDALDFGKITWKNSPANYRLQDGEYTFSGIGLEQLINDNADSDDYLDSLGNTFNVQETNTKYTTQLNGKLMLTGQYRIAEGTYGILALRSMMVAEEMIPSAVLMVRKDLGRRFTIAANYSRQYNSINAIGAGVYLRLGTFNFFVSSDNLPGTIFPLDSRTSQVSFGLSVSQLRAIKKPKQKKQENQENKDVIERY